MIEEAWAQKTLGEFVLVAPAAGRTFYVNSLDGKVRYEDFFIREFLPAIEGNYRIQPGRHSRGDHRNLHGRIWRPALCLSLSAALRSGERAQRRADRAAPGRADHPQQQTAITRLTGTAFGVPFDRAYWDRESPFTIVRTGPKPAGLKIYFDCGTEDGFGFNAGAQAFHDLLQSKGIAHEFHLFPGGHTWNYFAEHFPDSLEFQARAFGLGAPGK